MKNLLNLLIELATTSPYKTSIDELISSQPRAIQEAFLQQQVDYIKQTLSSHDANHCAHQRTVVSI